MTPPAPPLRAEPPADFRLRSLIIPAYGPMMLTSAAAGAVLPVVVLRAQQLGASLAQAALVIALAGIAPLLAAIPAGALVARIGERHALLAAGMVDVLGYATAGVADRLWLLGLGMFVAGMGSAVYFLARQGFMIDVVPTDQRARAMSTLGGSMRIGFFVGPVLSGVAIHRWGLSAAYAVAVLCAIGSVVVVAYSPDLTAEHEAARNLAQPNPEPVLHVIWRYRQVLLTTGLGVALIAGLREARFTALPLWAAHIGLRGETAALVFAVAGAVEVALFYPGGYVMDRWGRRIIAMSVPAGIGLALVLLPATQSVLAFGAVAVLIALGSGFGSGIVMTLGADYAPHTDRTQFLAGWRLCGESGRAALPLLMTAVTALLGLAAACLTAGVMGLLGTAFIARVTHRSESMPVTRIADRTGSP